MPEPIAAPSSPFNLLPAFGAFVMKVFADMLGWDELVAEIARVYASLAPDERRLAVIWGNSYGTAGAVDYLGRAYGLPKAISGHQNYYLWKPRELAAGPMIAVGFPKRAETVGTTWFKVATTATRSRNRLDARAAKETRRCATPCRPESRRGPCSVAPDIPGRQCRFGTDPLEKRLR
jgi:hypothetical protein